MYTTCINQETLLILELINLLLGGKPVWKKILQVSRCVYKSAIVVTTQWGLMITFGTPFQSVNRMTFKMQNSFTFSDGMKWGLVRIILLIIRGSRTVYYIALLISMGSWKFSREREFMEWRPFRTSRQNWNCPDKIKGQIFVSTVAFALKISKLSDSVRAWFVHKTDQHSFTACDSTSNFKDLS